MKSFAVIDIGSNSVRLMIVADGKVLYKTLQTTRLGEGLEKENRLQEVAIARSARAVAQFYTRAKNEGAQTVLAFATAAVRKADNGEEFLQAVRALCPLQVQVVSGETEAEIGILGALGNQDGAVIDVGGASTELVVKRDSKLVYKKSVDIGVVRLKDKCGQDEALLKEVCLRFAKEYGEVKGLVCVHAIGGTATTLGAIKAGLANYDGAKVTGTEITASEMQTLADRLLSMTVGQISQLPCVMAGRADVLKGGAVLLATIAKYLGIEKFIISDRDNLEGYAVQQGLM